MTAFLASASPAMEEPTISALRQARQWTARGQKALQAGNLGKARTLFERAVERLSSLPEAHLGLGHIAMRERRFADALDQYESARHGYVTLGDALYEEELRRYNTAQERIQENRRRIADLQRSLGNDPRQEDPRIRTRITQLEHEIRRLESLELPREDGTMRLSGEVYFFIGNALGNLDRYDEALEAWETCVHRSPGFAPVYNNLAVAYWRANRLEEARDSLTKAEELGVSVNPQFKRDLERSLAEAGLSVESLQAP